jgi:hypothetical protein
VPDSRSFLRDTIGYCWQSCNRRRAGKKDAVPTEHD